MIYQTSHQTQSGPRAPGGIPLVDNGRTIGYIRERSGVKFVDKRIDAAKHLHRKLNGYGLGDEPLSRALAMGVQYVRFFDKAAGLVFLADVELFRKKGIRIDQGYGVQWILPLQYWTTPDGQALPATTKTATNTDLQLSLWKE